MAGSIENRLRRLEGDQPQAPCPGCGDDGDPSNVRFEVVWGDDGDPGEPERCPECGRALELVVTWGNIDNREEGGVWRRA